MIIRTFVFLIINFAALGVGSIFTGSGVPSEWYQNLDKAPWTPPGWMFGAAWTTIMICFSFYMAYAWKYIPSRNLILGLFILQIILNVLWNPLFFKFHLVLLGLITITALTLLTGYFLIGFTSELKFKSLFVLPYFIWLIIATTLNAYILIKN